jgi:hypothetical protein
MCSACRGGYEPPEEGEPLELDDAELPEGELEEYDGPGYSETTKP